LVPRDTVDTARSERQYLVRAGLTRAVFRATLDDRVRNLNAHTYHDVTAAAQTTLAILDAGVRVKHSGFGTSRAEAWARAEPLSFFAVNASVARNTPPSTSSPSFSATTPTFNFVQAEAAIRLLNPWVAAGIMRQDTLIAAAPAIFAQGFSSNASGPETATYATVRGPLFRGLSIDSYLVNWPKEVFYRPRVQERSELRFRTNWISRFQRGEFELNSAVTHNYRSRVFFRRGTVSESVDAQQTVDLLLEIRILRGVASYQLRNMTGYSYENLPGFPATRAVNLYGIRWEFWN
jgi:hypothetical protein